MELKNLPQLASSAEDPFAEGREGETTREVLAYRPESLPADSPGWQVRVLPNMYPALQPGEPLFESTDDLYQQSNGVGVHEVIVECPQNEGNLSRLRLEDFRSILTAYRDRFVELKRNPWLAHATIFKNSGANAGASIHHAHSQLLATPYVPALIEDELAGSSDFHSRRGQNIFDELMAREIATGSRVVVDSTGFLAFCPFASRFSYEVWIVPKQPGSHYEQITAPQIEELASVLRSILRRLDVALDNPPYNYVLHTAPFHQPELPFYRWHFEIYPRLTRVAGFEWGSGCYINEVLPEQAAQRLRGFPL